MPFINIPSPLKVYATSNNMMGRSRSLPELAHLINSRTLSIYDILTNEGLPQPSFEFGAPIRSGPYSNSLEDKREELLEALDELRALILGPAGHIFFKSFTGPTQTATLQVLYKFEIPKHVPLKGPISYAELAAKCGLSEALTRRYVRSATSFHIFTESSPDFVKHNAASAILATTTLHDWIGMVDEEICPAALKVAESIQRYPKGEHPNEAPIVFANGAQGDKTLFDIVVESAPERQIRFANAMAWSMNVPGMEPKYTIDSLGWSDPAKCPKVVVDIGGGTGTLSKAILETYTQVEQAIVQEIPEVVAQGCLQTDVSEALKARLDFKVYDFQTPQTVEADVYIMRCVLHDWPDSYAAQILRNQIPALKPGARILLNERCLEPPGEHTRVKDQFSQACDIMMGLCANGKERSRREWIALLALADKRFKLQSITTASHSVLSIIEVVWAGEEEVKGVDKVHVNGNGVDFHEPSAEFIEVLIQSTTNTDNHANGLDVGLRGDGAIGSMITINIEEADAVEADFAHIPEASTVNGHAEQGSGMQGGPVGSTVIGDQDPASNSLHSGPPKKAIAAKNGHKTFKNGRCQKYTGENGKTTFEGPLPQNGKTHLATNHPNGLHSAGHTNEKDDSGNTTDTTMIEDAENLQTNDN